jgi:hypothetical protein
MHEESVIEVAVGLAALLIGGAGGYAAGRGWIPWTAAGASASNGAAPADSAAVRRPAADAAAATASRDWSAAERGRPWESPRSVRDNGVESGPTAGDDKRAETERDLLIAACADLADRLRDRQQALYAALTRDLAAVGVELEAPDGKRFDADRHNAVGTAPAPEAAQDLLIAGTTGLGYRHHGVQVRVPDVIVYRWKEA